MCGQSVLRAVVWARLSSVGRFHAKIGHRSTHKLSHISNIGKRLIQMYLIAQTLILDRLRGLEDKKEIFKILRAVLAIIHAN